MKYKVLIADDNENSIVGLKLILKTHLDIDPIYLSSAAEALTLFKIDPYAFSAVVLDYHFAPEETTGAEVAKEFLKINPKTQIIICTGDSTEDSLIESLRARVTDFVRKSNIEFLVDAIRKCFPHYDQTMRYLQRERITLANKYSENEAYIKTIGMVGRSDKLCFVAETVKKAAETKATVLIRGECGTGKELVAKALHQLSNRSNYNFVAINCSAIPEALLESDLFGHEKGSFTGAENKKIGQFELAHRGTIFLDEIGDMPQKLQAKLLRVLQEQTFYPVGSTTIKKVDVRVVAATNVDLEKAVEEGRFREDLYYRLKVISVELPPLRDRVEDLDLLVLHFKDKFDRENKKRILHKTLDYFKSYNWPGNVRELENVIHNLMTLTDGAEIAPENLPAQFFTKILDGERTVHFNYDCDYAVFQKQVTDFCMKSEHDYVIERFRELKSLRETAKALNMSKSTLHRRLISWGYNLDLVEGRSNAVTHQA